MENYIMINGQRVDLSDEIVKEFKEKLGKKPTYDDVANSLFYDSGSYYIDSSGLVAYASVKSYIKKPNNSKTKEQLESILALNKLCNVAKYLNGDWLPDWSDEGFKYYLFYSENNISIAIDVACKSSSVYFKSKKLAQQAIEILGEEEIRKALTLNQ